MSQQALIVRTGPDGHEGLEELNIELERGWSVAEMSPMGGATGPTPGPNHAALVVLERQERDRPSPAAAVAALEEIGSETEHTVEHVLEEAREVVDGNGAEPLNTGEPPCNDPDEVE